MKTSCLLLFATLWAWPLSLVTATDPSEVMPLLVIERAEKLISPSATPPEFNAARSVPLPDRWQHSPDGFYGSVWYRLHFSLPSTPSGQWAVLLPYINMNAELWLNGVYLGSGGSMEKPVSRYWHSPMLFMLSSSDLREHNSLLIRVVAYADEFGELGKVLVGPAPLAKRRYQYEYFHRVNLHLIGTALAITYALFMGIVWYRRRDAVFFWGGLACAAWAVSSLNFFIVDPPLDELIWEKAMHLSIGWIPLLFYFFVLRLDGVRSQRLHDSGVLLVGLLFNLVLVLADRESVFAVSRIWQIYTLSFGVLGLVRVFHSWCTRREQPQLIMLITFIAVATCGIHDFLANNDIIDDEVFWLNYSIPIILLFIGYMMVSRFLWAVSRSEQLNQTLERRVRQAQKRIEADYQTILALETRQASQRERERIYRDMHDDMGAKLLSIVYNAENDEMRTLARSALNDLRAIVSKSPGKAQRLADLLQQIERETRKRCRQAGFAFHWQQCATLPDVSLSAEARQCLRRLFAESITNAIKHSLGNQVSVRIACRGSCLRVTVADNGDYTRMAHWVEGRGIQSMRHRIAQLQGRIRWYGRADGGGRVSWLLPLAPNLASGERA